METVKIKPEGSLKIVWYIALAFFTFLISAMFSPLIFVEPVGFLVMFVILLIPVFLIAIWIQFYFNTLDYEIDDEEIRIKKGVFWKRSTTIPHLKITNVDITQGPVERMFEIGQIHIQTAGAGGAQGARPEIVMPGVKNFNSVKDTILQRVHRERLGITAKQTVQSKTVIQETTSEQNIVFQDILKELKEIKALLKKA